MSEPRRITETAPLGATVCPSCGGWHWSWYRPLAVAVLIALLFPLGMLALLTRRRFACANCGLELASTSGRPRHTSHGADDAERTLIGLRVGLIFAFVGALIYFGLTVSIG